MAETIREQIAKARVAFDGIADYTQEQIDKLVYEVGKIIYLNAEQLAEMAVSETGLGDVQEKIGKNETVGAVFWDYLKDKKSVGIINEEPDEDGLIKVAHPVGVIAAITPATNPTVTPLGNFMHALKGKNAMIVSPAPRAQKTTEETVRYMREALEANGAPADLIQVVGETTIEKSQELMASCDLVIATGSMGLTKAAYSSGTPAYGVGPGNTPAIIDKGYDKKNAAELSLLAAVGDNGMLCDGDNLLLYPEEEEAETFAALKEAGIAVYDDPADVDIFRTTLFDAEGKFNSGLVGKHAYKIADAAGVTLPNDEKVIGLKVDAIGSKEILCKEIMSPVVILKSYDTFENAVAMARQNMVEAGGVGHTAGVFTDDMNHVLYASERIPVSRLLVNQPTPDAWGPATNGLAPAVSEGCGTWGNNVLSENVNYTHMINISRTALPLDVVPRTPAEVFGDK